MTQQILNILLGIPEKEQNNVLLEVRNAIREERMKQANALEIEAKRIKETLNQI